METHGGIWQEVYGGVCLTLVPRKPGTLAFLQGNQQGTLGLNISPRAVAVRYARRRPCCATDSVFPIAAHILRPHRRPPWRPGAKVNLNIQVFS
jgi:hypothetical protein